jgi:hypothetical protein
MAIECDHLVQLLAALKQPQAAAPGAPAQIQPQPAAPASQLPQLAQNSFYPPAPTVQQPVQQPPPIYPGAAQPTAPGFPPLSHSSLPPGVPPPGQANPLANLPSNILALLQGAQAQQQPSSTPQPPQSTTPLPGPYGAVPPALPTGQMRPSMPPHLAGPPPPTVPIQSDYQGQMMNYFVSSITPLTETCL